MFDRLRKRILSAVVLATVLGAILALVASASDAIDPASTGAKYAWGENVGWINAEAPITGSPGVTAGVTVSSTKLTGYMWGENIGWINMNCSNNATCGGPAPNWGVTNDGAGTLKGYAWGENVGWISFSCTNTSPTCTGPSGSWGVTINPLTGLFSGKAYGENIGWLVFDYTTSAANRVVTDDGDGVAAASDNCKFDSNVSQANTDSGPPPPAGNTGSIDNGTGVTPVDRTVPNGDVAGDTCDLDRDNDGLPNSEDTEPLGAGICVAFSGSSDGHLNPAGGDITNDDNGNGDPAAPMGNDAADNGPSWDTDNDSVLDGYECARGSNPRDGASKPSVLADDGADDDSDGLLNGWERRGWGTNPATADTDQDGVGDCKEAADVDGNGAVNSTGDLVAYAKAIFNQVGKTVDFDLDKNARVNSTGDLVVLAQRTFLLRPCL